MIANLNRDNKMFFEAMKSLSSDVASLPLQMTYNSIQYYGSTRFLPIITHLKSCFADPIVYLRQHYDDFLADITTIYNTNYSDNTAYVWNGFSPHFRLEDVCRCRRELDIKKDPGPMNISPLIFKYCMEDLAPIILKIMNEIMDRGIMPNEWKSSFITPIPKKGMATNIANYRGIAMQSILPKILDRLLTEKLYDHINKLIPRTQHGFLRKRGTMTNLLEITQYLRDEIHKDNRIDVIYFDLAKAFDRVSHTILAGKLSRLALPFKFYKTIMSFITNRPYFLKADGIAYHEMNFTTKSSVAQGSHIGPLLFIVMWI